ncbi:NADH-ubiquinone oxidoreductase-F iron-sulfur binding region domain-containing protein [Brachybacterium squillarum]|uniref:NADH-ubiquinone oxidoreductase-F iron-sulfur binding region domain-containing protein n=1 Tax=Brachybacterium squillarum TaxID=661979 RepID=UPI002223E26B|nr:NADH-ubiquinone oxidoreductase-F iron-sulfur binding region domain-containing protein [Brachybacterium squillarum]MCW1804420.1 hypothetical protein [Brachybacterium squillarum]
MSTLAVPAPGLLDPAEPEPLPTVDQLPALITRSGLTGRGGAGFPVGAKIAALRRAPSTIVANASEGEPLSAKDAVLLRESPHAVIDGVLLLAGALAPRAGLTIMVHPRSAAEVRSALAARPDGRRVQVQVAQERFVAGEATAVAAALAGGEQIPADHPHHLTEKGLRGGPVLVQNAETLAHVARIARHGAEAFLAAGRPEDPGTRLVTIARPEGPETVLEVPGGSTLREVLHLAGTEPGTLDAVLVGGYHGRWALPDQFDVPLGPRPAPGVLGAGAGVLMLLDRGRCPLPVTTAILDHLAAESTGQCGPCVLGLPRIAASMHDLEAGHGDPARLRRRLEAVAGRGACHHPDGTAQLAGSTVTAFGPELDAHVAGHCTGWRR